MFPSILAPFAPGARAIRRSAIGSALAASVYLLSAGGAGAQMAMSPSEGCTAANSGDFDFSVDAGSEDVVANGFMGTFAAGEILTFTASSEDAPLAFAEDVTEDVEIMNGAAPASADYEIPDSGERSFNMELDTEDFSASFAVTCTPAPEPEPIVASEVSRHVIRNFLYRRANAILSAEPDRPRLVRKTPGVLWEGGVDRLAVTANDNGVNADIAASSGPIWGNKIDLWVEGHYQSYEYNNGLGVDGDFGVVYLGADYLLSEDILVGALGQLDWMSDEALAVGESVSGHGWMAGPYVSARLDENIFFDARAAWGRSNNDLQIIGLDIDDEFDTTRWLVRGALTGNRQFGDWRVTPAASVAYYEEKQKAYMSALGVFIAEQTVSLGRAEFGPELAYRYVTQSGVLIEPQISLTGIWDFETPDGLSIPGWVITTDDLRMRAEAGVMVAWTNGFALRASGFYDGVGASGFESYGARAWIDVPIGPRNGASPPVAPQTKTCANGAVIAITDACAPPDDITADLTFAPGKASLSNEAYDTLAAAWAKASAYEVNGIVIKAHGDGGAASAENKALAERRARAVKAALQTLGAPEDLILSVMNAAGAGGLTQVIIELE